MFSPSDRGHHKTGTSGSSNKGGRRLRSFDDALIDYERFMFDKMTGRRSNTAAAARSCEVVSVEVRGDQRESVEEHGKSEGVLFGIEERDDSSLAALGGIIREILVELVHTFHLPRVYKVLIPRETDSPIRSL
ncbi:hypothetical protein ACOSQ3_006287 [Xanthoceras sorbifolium]